MEKNIDKIVSEQDAPLKYREEIEHFAGEIIHYPDGLWSMCNIFLYGQIVGIRKERARRKAAKA